MSVKVRAMDERCQREIRELHRFFADWFTGRVPDEEPTFNRLDAALADGFQIIPPNGQRVDKPQLLEQVRSAHGAHADSGFIIEIRRLHVRFVEPPVCLVTYEEWQRHEDTPWNVRLSSALFRESEDAPNGVQWLHVHEVGLDASD